MARRTTHQLAYRAIRIEGGLIPADELARLTTLQTPDKTEQTDTHYGTPKGLKLRDELGRFWKIAQSLWSDFQTLRQRSDVDAHRATVNDFLVPLLRDVLGFADLASGSSVEASGHSYNIGHAARAGRLPIILAGHSQPLDASAERFGELNPDTGKTRRRSPFMLAQEALNASDQSLWAITSNGLTLRILRDNPSLTRPAYVEVDLEALFSEDLYADFTAFWLLAHASRFGKADAESADCPWERWRAAGQEAGVTIRSNLRYQVAEALRALGTGFLSHPANQALRHALQNAAQDDGPSLGKQAFFEELLGLVYRLIFLATVEDRTDPAAGLPLIFTPGALKDVQQRYLRGYSLTWLRERAVRRSSHDTHSDLWQALSITFDGLAQGQSALGLPALGGLFDAGQCPNLDSAQIENRHLLAAVFQLGFFRQATGLTRVNYRDMGPEELGSVYESLLELVPDLQSLAQPHAARLAFVGDDDTDASTKGNTRKLTGSYYTPDSLVQELIKSALEPVIADTVKANPAHPVDALLQLTVCDPACGSGHFLLAAARRLADEVAKLRALGSANGAPTPADYRHALRDVVGHCIYGVDKNPMAIALAKTALWLEAYSPDRPLSFLDHHLQVGDALLGVLDPKILENGIPDAAYTALSGDDKTTASELKKLNKADLKSWRQVAADDLFDARTLATWADAVEHLADDSLAGIAAKRNAWAKASAQAGQSTLARLADTFVAAFLVPKLPQGRALIPLSGHLWGMLHPTPGQPARDELFQAADDLCRTYSVFHWWLAFPQIAAKGGFSVMLGNPPWERIKLQEEEFFATRSPLVAMAQNKSERGKRIELLCQGLLLHTRYPDVEAAEGLHPPSRAEMRLHEEFIVARRGAEAASLYAHDSRRYPLTGVGDVNTYALFAETVSQLVAMQGRAGFIVPTGIATDDTTKKYFRSLVFNQRLSSLLSFYEVRRWFPATDDRKPFCLLTLGHSPRARFAYDLEDISDLAKLSKWYELSRAEFELLNPNTRTLPIFRSQRDAELTKKLHRAAPVLIEEVVVAGEGADACVLQPERNPWGISFQRMLDMSNDSGLFRDAPALPVEAPRLPVYEAKMAHQFDHRWATYVDAPDKPNGLDTADMRDAQKADPACTVRPRYWVDERQVLARIARVPARVANAWLALHAAQDAARDASATAVPNAVPTALTDAQQALTLAVAGWVGAALFARAADAAPGGARAGSSAPSAATASLFDEPATPPADGAVPAGTATAQAPVLDAAAPRWTNHQRQAALGATGQALARRFPVLGRGLTAAYPKTTKLLEMLEKWAVQDDPAQGLGLSDAELNTFAAWAAAAQPVISPENIPEEIANNDQSTLGSGQFLLNIVDESLERRSPRWLMGWRDICRSTDERTMIASVLPRVGVGHKMPLFRFPDGTSPDLAAAIYANFCALVLDYSARQKVGGTSLTYHYLKQFPVLPADRYTDADLAFIVPRVLELTYTAHDLKPWADDLTAVMPAADPRPAPDQGQPFPWYPERRAHLRAELDAYYARLYGLTRDELRYILDPADVMGPDYPSETFRVLKNNEMREFGEYRTRRLVLAAWDRLAAGDISLQPVNAGVSSPFYSALGVISNEAEAELAGLIAALIDLSPEGISAVGLQEVVAHVQMADGYLEPGDAARLGALVDTVDALRLSSVLTLIPPMVQRLEASGSIGKKRSGNTNVYFAGGSPLPPDVLSRTEHTEMAKLMLKLETRRTSVRADSDSDAEQVRREQGNR